MDLLHNMSANQALQMYKVLLKYLKRVLSSRADTILWQTDVWTDRWMHGETQYVSEHWCGGYNNDESTIS